MEQQMSENRYVLDMSCGNITQILLQFSVPLLVGNLFQQVYNVVDSIVVGRYLGSKALGAVGSVGMISFLFFSLCMGLSSGIGVIVSNCFGAKKEEEVKTAIANSIYVIVAVGILMSILGFIFSGPILHLMNTPSENFENHTVAESDINKKLVYRLAINPGSFHFFPRLYSLLWLPLSM